jgi:hypothetical protein
MYALANHPGLSSLLEHAQCAPRQAGRRLLDAAQAGPSAADLAADAAVQLAQPAGAAAQVSGPCGLSA